MSARTAAATPGYWTLTATSAPVGQPRAVDLPDRGGGDRLLVELHEDLAQRRLELGLDHLAHVGEAHLRRGVAQRAELALELLAVLLRARARRRGSSSPARASSPRPSSSPARSRSAPRPRGGAAPARRLRPSSERARFVAWVPELARRLAGREARHLGRAGDPRGGDAVLGQRTRAYPSGPAWPRWAGASPRAGQLRGDGRGGARRSGWRTSRRRRRRRRASRSRSASASRRRPRSRSASPWASGVAVLLLRLAAQQTGRALGVADLVAEDGELGRGDHAGADHGGEQAGDDREAQREAAAAALVLVEAERVLAARRELLRPVAARAHAGGLLGSAAPLRWRSGA